MPKGRCERRAIVAVAWLSALASGAPLGGEAAAQADGARRVEVHFTPTARAQIALWIESADGSRFRTIRLTESVAYRGIGNRPGALQMNSGYLWPYGRREGVLPVWAHRRLAAGEAPFPRVIFNGRVSEGNASNAGSPGEPRNTEDPHFCLSFDRALSGRDNLDATTCPSIFRSNKGRYVRPADVANGYAEPFERGDGSGTMRPLELTSPYPPRRDVAGCPGEGCGDHADVASFAADARAAMPAIDAVTMATPAGDRPQEILFDVPAEWPDGDYVVYLEINVEGDWNDVYNAETYPTPTSPSGTWDYWAREYGYAYRGQPSVVFRVPIAIRTAGDRASTAEPAGYGALQGEDGELRAMDATFTHDPAGAPGSGVDRLRLDAEGRRLTVVVPTWDVCDQPEPPAMCGRECTPGSCGPNLLCGPDATCVGLCDVPMRPEAVEALEVETYPDEKHSHQWGRLRFRVPESARALRRYEVRVGTEPIVDEASFERALPAVEPSIERVELTLPVEGAPGERVEVDFGGLRPRTRYWVAVRAVDTCNAAGPVVAGELRTTEIHFTTVSPCFVATAAWGTPMAAEVGALRRFRDRHLRNHALGRALVDAYYAVGPHAAGLLREEPVLRSVARALLRPLVALFS
jgi:hypothetical protein